MDSTKETLEHRKRVGILINRYLELVEIYANMEARDLFELKEALLLRAKEHDESKLHTPEKEIFDEYTPLLKKCVYGSEEYKSHLNKMNTALMHHYASNRHHPEHFTDGIAGMSTIDLTEMLCDWVAATERHTQGNVFRSIELNQERFNYPNIIRYMLNNTAILMLNDVRIPLPRPLLWEKDEWHTSLDISKTY